eukprot:1013710-Prorocentrum_minimum.AAC.2
MGNKSRIFSSVGGGGVADSLSTAWSPEAVLGSLGRSSTHLWCTHLNTPPRLTQIIIDFLSVVPHPGSPQGESCFPNLGPPRMRGPTSGGAAISNSIPTARFVMIEKRSCDLRGS